MTLLVAAQAVDGVVFAYDTIIHNTIYYPRSFGHKAQTVGSMLVGLCGDIPEARSRSGYLSLNQFFDELRRAVEAESDPLFSLNSYLSERFSNSNVREEFWEYCDLSIVAGVARSDGFCLYKRDLSSEEDLQVRHREKRDGTCFGLGSFLFERVIHSALGCNKDHTALRALAEVSGTDRLVRTQIRVREAACRAIGSYIVDDWQGNSFLLGFGMSKLDVEGVQVLALICLIVIIRPNFV